VLPINGSNANDALRFYRLLFFNFTRLQNIRIIIYVISFQAPKTEKEWRKSIHENAQVSYRLLGKFEEQ
jgi:hypothetical protein